MSDEKQFVMKAPDARHHARWMSKVMYSIKIAMLRKHLWKEIAKSLMEKMLDLASFCLHYAKPWSRATLPFPAAVEDLCLYKAVMYNVNQMQKTGSTKNTLYTKQIHSEEV